MNTKLTDLLFEWQKPFIRDQDLAVLFLGQETKRYDAVKYALKKGILIQVRRGFYLIGKPFEKEHCDPFEIASIMYGPSYISLESALSFHGWIPEAVITITSATAKRAKMIETPLGSFRYSHTPLNHFFLNVQRVENRNKKESKNSACFLVAEPWKAIADIIYCYRKNWESIDGLASDLRVEIETLKNSDRNSLLHISKYYESKRVRKILHTFLKELS